MEQTWPEANGLARELQFGLQASHELRKHDVYGHRVGVRTIRSRAENDVERKIALSAVARAPATIRAEPIEKVEKVGAGQCGDAVPGDLCEVEVFYVLAVNVKF